LESSFTEQEGPVFFSHHFAHRDTLSRAHSWLTQLGYHPQRIEDQATWIPRIAMEVEPHELDAVNMLINAVELTDPDGFPSFWDEARQPHDAPKAHHQAILTERPAPHPTAIGWHPID
jgi:hypothetical protein